MNAQKGKGFERDPIFLLNLFLRERIVASNDYARLCSYAEPGVCFHSISELKVLFFFAH